MATGSKTDPPLAMAKPVSDSSLPISDLTGNKLSWFSQAESVVPVLVIGEWLLHEACILFSHPCPAEEGTGSTHHIN